MRHLFDIADFGASADGKTKSTATIQEAIDACHAAGGGQVRIGPGNYVTGTLQLKSHVELNLTAGCRLVGSPDLEDYPMLDAGGFITEAALQCKVVEKCAHSLIMAVGVEGAAITGQGVIDGAGLAFYDDAESEKPRLDKPSTPRPRVGIFYHCKNMHIEGVSIQDSACWTLWLMQCEHVHIHRIQIEGNRRMRNGDGIDIDSCRNITVSDCVFDTEDDCLVLRAIDEIYEQPTSCENVTVTNCVLKTSCQGIRIGCPGDGIIRNATFSNLVIDSAKNGIRFDNPPWYLPASGQQCHHHVENILFANIQIDCAEEPVALRIGEGIKLSKLGDISFSNLRIRSGGPCVVEGSPQTLVHNIQLSDIHIETSGEQAVIVRHCSGIAMNNVNFIHDIK